MAWERALLGIAVLALAVATLADPAPIDTRVQWQVLPHELVAIDGAGGGEHRAPLGIGEQVQGTWADGAVGVALSAQRLFAVTTATGGVHEVRFHVGERLVFGPQLGDRVALAATTRRALGFDGGSGNWVESTLGPRESVLAAAVANGVAALATDRRVLALSPRRGGFFETPLALGDPPLALQATGDVATLRTRTRLLVFRAGAQGWSERDVDLGN
jgi:hypothetical protein